jgi:hypothetical protein
MSNGTASAEHTGVETFVLQWNLRADTEHRSEPVEPGNVPRISRLMALAIRFDDLIHRGEVEDYATLARLGHVTRARITQIMALLDLAPDIQEAILFLPRTTRGRDRITERNLRTIAGTAEWARQRQGWRQHFPSRNGYSRTGDASPEGPERAPHHLSAWLSG